MQGARKNPALLTWSRVPWVGIVIDGDCWYSGNLGFERFDPSIVDGTSQWPGSRRRAIARLPQAIKLAEQWGLAELPRRALAWWTLTNLYTDKEVLEHDSFLGARAQKRRSAGIQEHLLKSHQKISPQCGRLSPQKQIKLEGDG
ncbi:hypothetical protein Y032_0150g2770 [Ancylostoma ceylanicum]|uniref:Uncharacterized protein n=1 Tax=Ancylostoma ceylanicum TaxID=53326 RepID=A0A016T1K4_9BILA|nr:hypothetical protein Y032_0150g2770 [Ancylostoma ceylanicum]